MSRRILKITMLAIQFGACNDANFQSNTEQSSEPLALTVTCETDGRYNKTNQTIPVPNDDETLEIKVSGEFCPQAPAQLTVLFLVDFSLSMYNASVSPVRGNDPLIKDSCGRLKAAEAIKSRIESATKELKAKINLGVVSFSSQVVTSVRPQDISLFSGTLVPENFCGGSGKTNYRAAFEMASDLLEDAKGTKIVYFITDGLPSLGGDREAGLFVEHRDVAIEAATNLRNIDKLTMNTIFLGNKFEDVDFDPRKMLIDLTGAASRVKIVDTADDLASGILELENPPVNLDKNLALAQLESGTAATFPIKLLSFAPDTVRDQVWSFETAAFLPFANANENSQLVVEGQDVDGETYRVVFNFVPTPSL